MSSERYLNHPTFGMLYQVSPGNIDIYATLYAQKCFFGRSATERSFFEVIPYLDARNQAELNLQKPEEKDLKSYQNGKIYYTNFLVKGEPCKLFKK